MAFKEAQGDIVNPGEDIIYLEYDDMLSQVSQVQGQRCIFRFSSTETKKRKKEKKKKKKRFCFVSQRLLKQSSFERQINPGFAPFAL